MTSGWEQGKLYELRAKTDRQLYALVDSMLALGLRSDSAGNYFEAEQAYTEANRLLPVIYDLPAAKRLPLEARLAELRARLDEPAPTAACAP